jgi:plastocyanin
MSARDCAGGRKTATLALSGLATVLILAAAVGAPAAHVTIDNFSFSAPTLVVAAGTAVTWTNRDDIPHTITADGMPPSYRSHPLDTGDSFRQLFKLPGTYHYYCSLHPKMRGTVVVH